MIADVVGRLKQAPAIFALVEGAASFEKAAMSRPNALPAAYVIRLSDVADPSPVYGRTRQKRRTTVAIWLAASNVADAKGAAAQADIDALRDAVQERLLGWSPTGADPLEFDNGRMARLQDGVLWWQDVYRTQSTISSQ